VVVVMMMVVVVVRGGGGGGSFNKNHNSIELTSASKIVLQRRIRCDHAAAETHGECGAGYI
jgi:hypothetical protein